MAQNTSKDQHERIVYVIDDDLALREAVSSLLRSVGYQVRLFDTTSAFLDSTLSDAPGCLILDVRLPGISGLDFQSRLTELGVHLPVIFMTGFGDIPMSVQAMKAGAVDFLAKPFRDQDMLDAVSVALERDASRKTQEGGVRELLVRYETLTNREKEVMALVVTGLMNKQVAAELALSEVTVKIHRGNMMKKMQIRTLAELVRASDQLRIHGAGVS